MQPVAGYFTDKAAQIMRQAGGDRAAAGPLAEWAQRAKQRDQTAGGVIVGRDGTILAEYEAVQEGAGTVQRITRQDARRWGVEWASALDIATARISRAAGQPVVCVGAGEATMGAGKWTNR